MDRLTDELQAKAKALWPVMSVVNCGAHVYLRPPAGTLRRPTQLAGAATGVQTGQCSLHCGAGPPIPSHLSTYPFLMGGQSPAFSPPSVSSKMVSWKGRRPESQAGWKTSGLTPDTLAASYIPPPGLGFLTSWACWRSLWGLEEPGQWAQQRQGGLGRGMSVLATSLPSPGKAAKGPITFCHVSALEACEPGWQEQLALIVTSSRGTRPLPAGRNGVGDFGALGSPEPLGHKAGRRGEPQAQGPHTQPL